MKSATDPSESWRTMLNLMRAADDAGLDFVRVMQFIDRFNMLQKTNVPTTAAQPSRVQ